MPTTDLRRRRGPKSDRRRALELLELTPVAVRDTAELERSMAAFARAVNGGIIVTAGGTGFRRDLIIRLASRHKLPAVYPFRYYAKDGGLITYGPDTLDPVRRATEYGRAGTPDASNAPRR